MSYSRFIVAVIIRRIALENRWMTERWDPVAVEAHPHDDSAASMIPVPADSTGALWRFPGHAIELHRSEAEGYFLNMSSDDPKIFVMWREAGEFAIPPIRPQTVTVSYNEAARLLDGGERVDAVPMLRDVFEWMAPFVAEHYRPEAKRKVRRNDPFADGGGSR